MEDGFLHISTVKLSKRQKKNQLNCSFAVSNKTKREQVIGIQIPYALLTTADSRKSSVEIISGLTMKD